MTVRRFRLSALYEALDEEGNRIGERRRSDHEVLSSGELTTTLVEDIVEGSFKRMVKDVITDLRSQEGSALAKRVLG